MRVLCLRLRYRSLVQVLADRAASVCLRSSKYNYLHSQLSTSPTSSRSSQIFKNQADLLRCKNLLSRSITGCLQSRIQRFIKTYPARQTVERGTLSYFGCISTRQFTLGVRTHRPFFNGSIRFLITHIFLHFPITF